MIILTMMTILRPELDQRQEVIKGTVLIIKGAAGLIKGADHQRQEATEAAEQRA